MLSVLPSMFIRASLLSLRAEAVVLRCMPPRAALSNVGTARRAAQAVNASEPRYFSSGTVCTPRAQLTRSIRSTRTSRLEPLSLTSCTTSSFVPVGVARPFKFARHLSHSTKTGAPQPYSASDSTDSSAPPPQAVSAAGNAAPVSVADSVLIPALNAWTTNEALKGLVRRAAALMKPARVHLCDGTPAENAAILELMVLTGSLVRLNPDLHPNSFLARSTASDVARVEQRTFICSSDASDAGPTNNWAEPVAMRATLSALFDGASAGRTLYVVPFCMGPAGSPLASIGVEITDSPYAVANLFITTRMGAPVLRQLGADGCFVAAWHSCGAPLAPGAEDVPWPTVRTNAQKYVCHFPESREIFSFGSGYGGNALLPKKW